MTDHLKAAEPFLMVRARCQKSFNWQISQMQRLEELGFCLKNSTSLTWSIYKLHLPHYIMLLTRSFFRTEQEYM